MDVEKEIFDRLERIEKMQNAAVPKRFAASVLVFLVLLAFAVFSLAY